MVLLDCTLRDGGYYNGWDFTIDLINEYLRAMQTVGVDVVELGLRSLNARGFKGPCAFTKDEFVDGLALPSNVKLGVMVNASELLMDSDSTSCLAKLFPLNASRSKVSLVRIACHVHEFSSILPLTSILKDAGYLVGINLMQVADRSDEEIIALGREASAYPVDVLYVADSMGSMTPRHTAKIVDLLRHEWAGEIGIHTHDNMGLALSNTLEALNNGVTWVDSTVTGMGRGPGNARTEELAIEVAERRGNEINIVPLLTLIRERFKPMQARFGWGTNSYYYLAGKYGIHPTYIQEMLNDPRYREEDVLAVIEYLRLEGGKSFSPATLDVARSFYIDEPKGNWSPKDRFLGREVMLLGTGEGVVRHKREIERYIKERAPVVIALNTQCAVDTNLIDIRVACHPVRMLADCETHSKLTQPLITPFSMLPDNLRESLAEKDVLDFGLAVQQGTFLIEDYYCVIPSPLVVGYALAVASSGRASKILMAGFDGYGVGDPRSIEMIELIQQYKATDGAVPLIAITSTSYGLVSESVYGL